MTWSGCQYSRLSRCGECESCRQTDIDEAETDEIVRMDGTLVAVIHVGLDLAWMRARIDYLQGRIDVEQFEAKVDRILHKRAALAPHA